MRVEECGFEIRVCCSPFFFGLDLGLRELFEDAFEGDGEMEILGWSDDVDAERE